MEEKYANALEFDIKKFVKPIDYHRKWANEAEKGLMKQPEEVKNFIEIVYNAKKIFDYGLGRSEAALLLGGIRLKQMGYEIYHSTDRYKPPISEGDAIICNSSSGETPMIVNAATTAKKNNAKAASICSRKSSTLAKISDVCIILKSSNKNSKTKKNKEPVAFLGSRFEIKSIYFSELVINEIAKRKGFDEEYFKKHHANLE